MLIRTRSLGLTVLSTTGDLIVQHDLVLRFCDVRALHRPAAVGLGDGLVLDPGFLVAHQHGVLLMLGDDILAQPGTAALGFSVPTPSYSPEHVIASSPEPARPVSIVWAVGAGGETIP